MLELVSEHSALFVTGAAFALEFVLRKIPGAWPLTKIVYEALNKVAANREAEKK